MGAGSSLSDFDLCLGSHQALFECEDASIEIGVGYEGGCTKMDWNGFISDAK